MIPPTPNVPPEESPRQGQPGTTLELPVAPDADLDALRARRGQVSGPEWLALLRTDQWRRGQRGTGSGFAVSASDDATLRLWDLNKVRRPVAEEAVAAP
jgi:hypothetical protein